MADLPELVKKLYPDSHRKVMEAVGECWRSGKVESNLKEGWHKQLQLYVTYADGFCDEQGCGFDALAGKLEYIKKLGCNSIHVLPFLDSPMVDAGFDISDYYQIREELGGNKAFESFLDKAKDTKLEVFMDMVFNHVSEEHRWFRQAISGDSFYRGFFVHSHEKPGFIKRFADEKGVWGRYEIGEKQVDIRVIFPEQAGKIPHWRKMEDGCWYYHTFYPQQIDLDWNNYNVFVAFSKVMVYWAKRGVHFRLDAIPFVGKNVKEGKVESTERTHLIIQALNQVLKRVSEKGVFLLEVAQPVYVLRRYFGEDPGLVVGSRMARLKRRVLGSGKREKVVEAELAYNFPLMSSVWLAILTGDVASMWSCLVAEEKLPSWASWVTLLRNHDELSLKFASEKQKTRLMKGLVERGAEFREGFGVAGRTASLLDFDERRIVMAHMFLASVPGSPAIIYGDETAKGNDFEYMKQQTREKRERTGSNEIVDDTRDINRGWIGEEELSGERAQRVYKELSRIFRTRLKMKGLATSKAERVEVKSKSVFAARYEIDGGELLVLVNLGQREERIELKGGLSSGTVVQWHGDTRVVLRVNGGRMKGSGVELPGYGGVWVVNAAVAQ